MVNEGFSAYSRFYTKRLKKVTVGNVRTIYVDELNQKSKAEISWSSVSGATGYIITSILQKRKWKLSI